MYALPSAPRPIGGVLDDTIRLYRASLARCWGLALTAGLLTAASSVYLQLQLGTLNARTTTPAGAMVFMNRLQAVERSPRVWLSYLAMILIWVVIRAAILRRQHAVAVGREESIEAALTFGIRRIPSMIVAGIIWAIAIGAGMILFLIPGIWLWGRFELWLAALCVEDIGPLNALRRSWQLIEGNWWRATTIVTVVLIIILVLSMTSGLAVAAVLGFSRGNLTEITFVSQLFTALISVFTIPMLTAVMLSLYYDLKLRREGGDLAVRLRSLH